MSQAAGGNVPQVVLESDAEYVVFDHDNGNAREFDKEGKAIDAKNTLDDLGGDPEIFGDDWTPIPNREDGNDSEVVEVERVDDDPPEPDTDLPERTISDDPIEWLNRSGDQFVDEIDGTNAINRRGFEVLSHFYEIDVHAELQSAPEDNDHEYCRVKATATTPDGRECEAFGSASTERGDDRELLLEMADTRARKRALSIATGVGAVAVEELKNEVRR